MTDCETVHATMGCRLFCKSQCHSLTFRDTLTRTIHHLSICPILSILCASVVDSQTREPAFFHNRLPLLAGQPFAVLTRPNNNRGKSAPFIAKTHSSAFIPPSAIKPGTLSSTPHTLPTFP